MLLFPIEILLIENDSDHTFMEQVYTENEKTMYYWAYSILRNKEDASDAVHSACVALIKNIPLMRTFNSCTLRSYIVSTVRNASIDAYRKRSRQNEFAFMAGDDIISLLPDDAAIEDSMILAENILSLNNAIKRLPANESNLLRWKYFDELPDKEIAQLLEINPASVRAYLTKARRHLYELLAEKV